MRFAAFADFPSTAPSRLVTAAYMLIGPPRAATLLMNSSAGIKAVNSLMPSPILRRSRTMRPRLSSRISRRAPGTPTISCEEITVRTPAGKPRSVQSVWPSGPSILALAVDQTADPEVEGEQRHARQQDAGAGRNQILACEDFHAAYPTPLKAKIARRAVKAGLSLRLARSVNSA